MTHILVWKKWIGLYAVLLMLVSCATSLEVIKERRETLDVKVIAFNAGITVETISQAGQVHLLINDVDGVSLKRFWTEKEVSEKTLRAMLRDCQKKTKPGSSGSVLIRETTASCAAKANLPPGKEVPQPDATRYAVALSTFAKPEPLGAGIPISRSGGPLLGGVRIVGREETTSFQTRSDVNQCVDRSLEDGLLDSFSGSSRSNSREVFSISNHTQSIAGFLKRFDKCLGNLGYDIEVADSGNKGNHAR